jgi:uncharacterized PurR-regulated membrane protein YhhQ (DUF165 family)
VRCRDATVISFVAKVLGEVFAHVYACTVRRHSSMQNWFLSAKTNYLWIAPLMSNKIMSMLLTLLFTRLAFLGLGEFGLSVYGSLSTPNACLIISRISVALVTRCAQNVMHTHCRSHLEIASGWIHDSK